MVKELLLHGREGAYIVSSSKPIEDTQEGRKQQQPPHIQAKKCYVRYLKEASGAKFLVTMEEPNAISPEPLIFNIENNGITRGGKATASAIAAITSSPAPRAG